MGLPSPVDYQIYAGGPVGIPPGKAFAYLMSAGGVFKAARRESLEAVIPVATTNGQQIAGLPVLWPQVLLRCGMLPGALLWAILQGARRESLEGPREAMFHVALRSGLVVLTRPEQQAGAGKLVYRGGGDPDIFLEVHSHQEMGAFFSGTDDRDEQGFRLYAVIGRIFTAPEIALRVGVFGDFWAVDPGDVFTDVGGWGRKAHG